MIWLYDIVALIAITFIGTGAAYRYGWEISLIAVGSALLLTALVSARQTRN